MIYIHTYYYSQDSMVKLVVKPEVRRLRVGRGAVE